MCTWHLGPMPSHLYVRWDGGPCRPPEDMFLPQLGVVISYKEPMQLELCASAMEKTARHGVCPPVAALVSDADLGNKADEGIKQQAYYFYEL